MPAFQALVGASKRKAEDDDAPPAKRANMGTTGQDCCWLVQWRNPTNKKHKTYEGEAFLVITQGSKATLYDEERKTMAVGKIAPPFVEGKEIGGFGGGSKDIHLDRQISMSEFRTGACFQATLPVEPVSVPAPHKPAFRPHKTFNPPLSKPNVNPSPHNPPPNEPKPTPDNVLFPSNTGNISRDSYWSANWRKSGGNKKKDIWEGDAYIKHEKGIFTMLSEEGKNMATLSRKDGLSAGQRLFVGGKEVQIVTEIKAAQIPNSDQTGSPVVDEIPVAASVTTPAASKRYIPVASFYGTPPKPQGPLHDPKAEGAIVMKYPTQEHIERYNKKNRPVVDVVLDPILARRMRPHQHEGVKFLYECVMGLRKHEGNGCILADEIPRQHVLLVGYERLRTITKEIATCGIGLIVCDEGHRLKSSKGKTFASFKSFNTPRRIILSGTPIQNDLSEFHSMVGVTLDFNANVHSPHRKADFCNPGLLGMTRTAFFAGPSDVFFGQDDYTSFKRMYENPIVKSRAPGCTAKELELGEKRSTQLMTIAKSFVLRREATILGNYLPPKTEYVVFVTPSPIQLSIFAKLLQPDQVEDYMHSTVESLAVINLLTKVSSSPILLKAALEKDRGENNFLHRNIRDAVSLLPPDVQVGDTYLSGKLTAIARLLHTIRETTDEKCVLVSHYTSTLNILEAFCIKQNYSYFRLDGQTPIPKRQEYVNVFNKTDQKSGFIFLLSSKAGGVGINLIGGSRLCLVDSDWNPSHDLQSMARCHRDGQKKPVFIYRFLTAGTIDEKIFQRQIIKLGLSNALMGSDTASSKGDSFTKKDLRDIFRVDPNTCCNTHDLIDCTCQGDGPDGLDVWTASSSFEEGDEKKGFVCASQVKPLDLSKLSKADIEYLERKKASLASLDEWKHVNCLKADARDEVQDEILTELLYTREPEMENADSDGLLAAVDLERIERIKKARDPLTVGDVPGGTISFIFEKSTSVTAAKGDADDIADDAAHSDGSC
ncbi:helicase [Paramarasmius palmivorus]|uniref:Helicase n=1 Tax=Paramarasmius palmivorus TaxID=297713 RepID=A0AAW0C8I7_9AGAR